MTFDDVTDGAEAYPKGKVKAEVKVKAKVKVKKISISNKLIKSLE